MSDDSLVRAINECREGRQKGKRNHAQRLVNKIGLLKKSWFRASQSDPICGVCAQRYLATSNF